MIEINIGLIGCGTIGSTLATAIKEGKAGNIKLIAICDVEYKRVEQLNWKLGYQDIFLTTNPNDIVEHKNLDLIIEAASQEVVRNYAEEILNNHKNLMIMSVGAMANEKFCQDLIDVAKKKDVKIYVPSGAICGLDGIKSANVEKLRKVEIITIKNPRSLEGAPYLIDNKIDITNITKSTTIYKGSAKNAAKGFPKNVNVAVALSLAGIGVDRTIVKIIADPNVTRTSHVIRATGDFGELTTNVNNFIHPENPKTSYLAALSAISTLEKLTNPIQVGT